jgi:serine protease Do
MPQFRIVLPLLSTLGMLLSIAPLTRGDAPKPSSKPAATQPSAKAAASPTTRPAVAAATSKPTTQVLARRPAPSTRPVSLAIKDYPENIADLKALQTQVEAVVTRVSPAVVGLRVGGGQGSGVIISDDGYVLTAGHVASAPGHDVTVVIGNGRTFKGKSLGVNYDADSGLVKILDPAPNGGKWPFVEIGKSSQLKKGQWCIVLGHPGGFRQGRTPPLRLGRILDPSSKFIRTDCTLVGGDSGGPLFDLEGRVIGINSRIGNSLNDNMHVPVDTFYDTWDRLASSQSWGEGFLNMRPGAPYLGLDAAKGAPDCRIGEIFPDMPAAKAGLHVGDLITSFDGQKVANFGELMLKLGQHKPGDGVRIVVKRDNQTLTLSITIGQRPRPGR